MLPLQLNCLVLGDDPNNIVPVKIADTVSVGALMETVQDRMHVSQHVDAKCLALWKVSIPGDRNLEEKINNLDLANKEP